MGVYQYSNQFQHRSWKFIEYIRSIIHTIHGLLFNVGKSCNGPVLEKQHCSKTIHMLWGALPLDGVGSCRLFFTDDLRDTLSWVPPSDKPHFQILLHALIPSLLRPPKTLSPRDWPGPHPIYLTIGTHDMPKPPKPTLPNQNGKVAYP